MLYRIAIVDDEPLIRERIRYLLDEFGDFHIVFEGSNGQEALEHFNQTEIDVLFIDIKMPLISGFELLDQIVTNKVHIIFITAYDNYAVKAFEYEAFDYLLKPITEARFSKTINRLLNTLKSNPLTDIISIRSNKSTYKLHISEITHLEAADNYVIFHTRNKSYRMRSTLSEQVNTLASKGIIRIHRSYAVNQSSVQSLSHIYNGEYLIRLTTGRIIPSSKAYTQTVQSLIL